MPVDGRRFAADESLDTEWTGRPGCPARRPVGL